MVSAATCLVSSQAFARCTLPCPGRWVCVCMCNQLRLGCVWIKCVQGCPGERRNMQWSHWQGGHRPPSPPHDDYGWHLSRDMQRMEHRSRLTLKRAPKQPLMRLEACPPSWSSWLFASLLQAHARVKGSSQKAHASNWLHCTQRVWIQVSPAHMIKLEPCPELPPYDDTGASWTDMAS